MEQDPLEANIISLSLIDVKLQGNCSNSSKPMTIHLRAETENTVPLLKRIKWTQYPLLMVVRENDGHLCLLHCHLRTYLKKGHFYVLCRLTLDLYGKGQFWTNPKTVLMEKFRNIFKCGIFEKRREKLVSRSICDVPPMGVLHIATHFLGDLSQRRR